jgi:4-amino-4-deoxy-L-arabinose transferase-like glycosyltransferase
VRGVFSRRVTWWLLAVAYVAIAWALSVVQPLTCTPDEVAHMQYVHFLAEHRRLPVWEPDGGEAGYESQHPPAYYALMAGVYSIFGGLEERWRWHLLRWATIGLGCVLFAACARLFRRLWPDEAALAWVATATTMLMPLTILYTGYINPDSLAQLCCAVTLLLAAETALGRPHLGRAVWLGAAVGLGCLAKLSAAPALLVALLAYRLQWRRARSHEVFHSVAVTLVACIAVCGWWYARNALLYGTPFIHTSAPLGSALENALRRTMGFGFLGRLTLRETYLSSWMQRGWLPSGWPECVLYGLIMLATLGAVVGLVRRKSVARAEAQPPSALDAALHLGGWLLLGVVVGHQLAYWLVDVEFNAGGRYVLVAMPVIAMAIVSGASALLRGRSLSVALAVWVIGLLAMNAASAYNILIVLNPRYAPGWDMFHFPP